MPRRTVLATLGTVLTTGCASIASENTRTEQGDSTTDTPTDTQSDSQTTGTAPSTTTAARRVPMGRTVTVGDARLTVANPRVRKAVVSRGAHTYVVAGAGQFVVVEVTSEGTLPGRPDESLRSSVDGTPLADGGPVTTTAGQNAYAFPFPAERHERAAIRWAGDSTRIAWELPEPIRTTLAQEPGFRVESLDVTRRDGERALEMTVTNQGARDGLFRARVSIEGFSGGEIVEFPVPAGESRVYTGSPGDLLLLLANQGGGTLTIQYPTDDGLSRLTHDVSVTTTQPAN